MNDEEADDVEGSMTATIGNGVETDVWSAVEEEADVTIGNGVEPVVGTTVEVDTNDDDEVGLTTDEVDSGLLFLETHGFLFLDPTGRPLFLLCTWGTTSPSEEWRSVIDVLDLLVITF